MKQRLCVANLLTALQLVSFAPAWAAESPLTRVEMQEFLLTAEIVDATPIGSGVTQPWRLTLSDGTLTHDAAFQSVDDARFRQRLGRRTEINFVDAYRYNIAAYRVAEFLGLEEMMPVTVEREWEGRPGALSWWLDDVIFNETTRLAERRWPEDMSAWTAQMYRMLLFAELVYDTDRNQGNVVYTEGWKLNMIDFTRAFRTWNSLQAVSHLVQCDAGVLERLAALTETRVREATDPFLTGGEIQALLSRRDKLVAHFNDLIAQRGAARVLYPASPVHD